MMVWFRYCIFTPNIWFLAPFQVSCVYAWMCVWWMNKPWQVLRQNNECFQLLSRRVFSFSPHPPVFLSISPSFILHFSAPFHKDFYWSEQKNLLINNINLSLFVLLCGCACHTCGWILNLLEQMNGRHVITWPHAQIFDLLKPCFARYWYHFGFSHPLRITFRKPTTFTNHNHHRVS